MEKIELDKNLIWKEFTYWPNSRTSPASFPALARCWQPSPAHLPVSPLFPPPVAQLAPHPLGLLHTTRSAAQLLLHTSLLNLHRCSASARPLDARTHHSPAAT